MNNRYKGISIIVLVITVVTMLILTGVVVQFFVKENPVDVAYVNVLRANIATMQEMLNDQNGVSVYTNKPVDDLDTLKKLFPDIPVEILNKIKIEAGIVKIDRNKLTDKEYNLLKDYI